MNDFDQFERRLGAAIRSDADESVRPFETESIARAAIAGTQPGAKRLRGLSSLPARRFGRGRGMTLLAAAALLVIGGALAAGSGVLRLPSVVPPVPAPSFGVVATASPDASSPHPSQLARASAGPTQSAVADPAGAWIDTGRMITPRYGYTAVRLLDGRVLVVGGSDGKGGSVSEWPALTSTELYDPASGTWSATGDLVHPYGGFPATLLRDGKVLVGDTVDPTQIDSIKGAEVYDPESGTWTATEKMVKEAEVYHGTATLLRDGRVLVAGANVAGDDGTQLYDPANGTWSATGKMVTPRLNHTATLLPDGRVLVAGGDIHDGMLYSAELYDPATGSWTSIANTHRDGPCQAGCPHGGGLATLLDDGTVLFTHPAPDVDFVEIFDPATGKWTPTGALARPKAGHSTLTRLLDGRVLATAELYDGKDTVVTAELYDPATESWTQTGNMLYGASSATLLLDGTVLVVGRDPSGAATNSAELYIPAGVSPPAGLAPIPSPTPIPTPKTTPIPTPMPTPFPPQAGPVPAGARSWTITVVNRSSAPGTLFLAEEGDNGIGQLCAGL